MDSMIAAPLSAVAERPSVELILLWRGQELPFAR